jgi:cation diffusion facilitator CzcD-associated flavoprotein CzcO
MGRPVRGKRSLRVAVVGAGFAGIGLAARLKAAGYANVVLFEKAVRLGGTWRDNTYPGAACDVLSHLYSFSFAPNADWRNRYARQGEILAYLEGVAERFGVKPLIRFGAAVTRAVYDEAGGTWSVETARGGREDFDVFVTAVGQLSLPSVPAFEGLERFRGAHFHSAAWDHSVPLDGKRVAVIGSAASAVQIVPELAKTAARLAVFQRTPNWVIPRLDWRYGPQARALYRRLPLYRRLTRTAIYLYQESLFGAMRTGSVRNRLMKRVARWNLERQVQDPALRAKLTPRYELGCKRVLLSDDYFRCFNLPNVELVTDPIERFEPSGIRTADGRVRDFDAAVFATGFDVRHVLRPVTIRGRGGLDLQERWSAGPEAYRGVAVPGFPNLFMLYGPNTNLGHNSILFMLECQFDYVRQCLDRLVTRDLLSLEALPGVTARYNRQVQARLAGSVWTTGCGSWYGDGQKITANWYGSTIRYWRETRRVRFGDFVEEGRHPAHRADSPTADGAEASFGPRSSAEGLPRHPARSVAEPR